MLPDAEMNSSFT